MDVYGLGLPSGTPTLGSWVLGIDLQGTHARSIKAYGINDPGSHVFNDFYGYPDATRPTPLAGLEDLSLPAFTIRHTSSYETLIRVPVSRSQPEVQLTFEADWLAPRSYGTCWVKVPALLGQANGAAAHRYLRCRSQRARSFTA